MGETRFQSEMIASNTINTGKKFQNKKHHAVQNKNAVKKLQGGNRYGKDKYCVQKRNEQI